MAQTPLAEAEKRLLVAARNHPRQLGKTVFPQDPFIQRELWGDDKAKIEKSITTRPDGSRKGEVTIFMIVSYRIMGDERCHVTHDVYGLLNVPIGTQVLDGQTINMPAAPNLI